MLRLAVVLVAVLVLVGACTSSSEPGVPGSFYLEATVTVIDDRVDAPHAEVVTHIRWWSESVDRWRWELDQSGADEFSADGSLSLSDGETVWFYDTSANTYQRSEPFELPDSFVATSLPISVLFGPANVGSLDDLAAEFLARGEDVEVFAAGTDVLLGVETSLLDYRPTWHSSSGSGSADSESGGVGRMWVDEGRMFILRHEIDGGANMQYVLVEVTHLEHEVAFDEGRFTFEPPAGAVEATPGSGGGSSSGSSSSDAE